MTSSKSWRSSITGSVRCPRHRSLGVADRRVLTPRRPTCAPRIPEDQTRRCVWCLVRSGDRERFCTRSSGHSQRPRARRSRLEQRQQASVESAHAVRAREERRARPRDRYGHRVPSFVSPAIPRLAVGSGKFILITEMCLQPTSVGDVVAADDASSRRTSAEIKAPSGTAWQTVTRPVGSTTSPLPPSRSVWSFFPPTQSTTKSRQPCAKPRTEDCEAEGQPYWLTTIRCPSGGVTMSSLRVEVSINAVVLTNTARQPSHRQRRLRKQARGIHTHGPDLVLLVGNATANGSTGSLRPFAKNDTVW
jgi:hypothetical protein